MHVLYIPLEMKLKFNLKTVSNVTKLFKIDKQI